MAYIPKILRNNIGVSRNIMKRQITNLKGTNNEYQVCLMGFQGCNLKQLKKHIKIYENLNVDTLIFTPGYLQNYQPKYVNAVSIEIAEQLKENNKKIIFHSISGGSYPLSLTMNNLILSDNKNLINKIIYDSSPVKCTLCSAIRALKIKLPLPENVIKLLLEFHYFKSKLPINEWCYDFYKFMGSPILNDIPKLFLISDNDPIVPLEDLDAFLESQRNYEKIIFNDAIHTKNILNDPELYKNSINNFIKKK